MKVKIIALSVCLALSLVTSRAQTDSLTLRKYPFIVLDKPAQLWTMRQFNQNYLSMYRLFASELDRQFGNKTTRGILLLSTIITLPLSHEEGHRSILTDQHIGSISKPYFNSKGAAYVRGVRDVELQRLRDQNLPAYIRLHTGGLESDYMVSLATEKLLTFGEDNMHILAVEYYARKLSIVFYYLTSPIKALSPELTEEPNELKRDIVGHDVYGAVRHLHRSSMNFYRYTDYVDLTSMEKRFVNRVAVRSLFSLLNPQLIGKRNFKVNEQVRANMGFGYTMTPFGDMVDNNIWLAVRSKTRLLFQNRIYQNYAKLFYGINVQLFDYPISKGASMHVTGSIWRQPENLSFVTHEATTGGLVGCAIRYTPPKFLQKEKYTSFDLGLQYKTRGFVPEEILLEEAWSVRLGITYCHKFKQ